MAAQLSGLDNALNAELLGGGGAAPGSPQNYQRQLRTRLERIEKSIEDSIQTLS